MRQNKCVFDSNGQPIDRRCLNSSATPYSDQTNFRFNFSSIGKRQNLANETSQTKTIGETPFHKLISGYQFVKSDYVHFVTWRPVATP